MDKNFDFASLQIAQLLRKGCDSLEENLPQIRFFYNLFTSSKHGAPDKIASSIKIKKKKHKGLTTQHHPRFSESLESGHQEWNKILDSISSVTLPVYPYCVGAITSPEGKNM